MIQKTNDNVAALRKVLSVERDALDGLAARLDDRADMAVEIIAACSGKLIVSGMGKCAHVGQKIAATFSSTGTPAVFLHPAEAAHGDIGVVQPGDAALVLSNSGETDDVAAVVLLLRERGSKILAFTGRPDSRVGRLADIALDTRVEEEGDPLGLAPMASTTAMLALGDAMAAAVMQRKGFGRDDYARNHPEGTLGVRLLARVADVMHSGDATPKLSLNVSVRQAIMEITTKRLGAVFLVDEEDRLTGILTDGDVRRMLQREPQPLEHPARDLMTRDPRTTTTETPAIDALRTMEADSPVTCLAVVDGDRRLVGALHIHDLIRAGIA